jgi:hypothetical protein
MSGTNIADTHEVEVADPADKLFLLLQLGKNSSSFTMSRTQNADNKGHQACAALQPARELLCLSRGNICLHKCCSSEMHYTRRLDTAEQVLTLLSDPNIQEETRYLAMFRNFYGIPATTIIA